jgi:hypothetical protein
MQVEKTRFFPAGVATSFPAFAPTREGMVFGFIVFDGPRCSFALHSPDAI